MQFGKFGSLAIALKGGNFYDKSLSPQLLLSVGGYCVEALFLQQKRKSSYIDEVQNILLKWACNNSKIMCDNIIE